LARKTGSARRTTLIIVLVLAVGIVAFMFLLFEDTTVPFVTGESGVAWIDPSILYLSITPEDGIKCWITNEIKVTDIFGRVDTLISTLRTVPLTSLVGLTTSPNEIRIAKLTPTLACGDTTSVVHDIRLAGGSVRLEFATDRFGGTEATVLSDFKVIPALNRSLKGNGIALPSLTVTADQIESVHSIPNDIAEVNIDLIGRSSSFASIVIDGTTVGVGDLTSGSKGKVKLLNENFVQTAPEMGITVNLIVVTPSQQLYINGDPAPVGSASIQQITTNDRMRMTIIGNLDNWSSTEGFPFVNIFDPRNNLIIRDLQLTNVRQIPNTIVTEFSRINIDIPIAINDVNIDSLKGTWRVEMHSNNDVRRTSTGQAVTSSQSFVLIDSRQEVIDPDPTNTPICNPLTEVVVNGKCELKGTEPPPPTTLMCPSISDMGIFVKSATNDELLAKQKELEDLIRAGNTQVCVLQFLALSNAEINLRNITQPPEEMPTGTTDTRVFIEYQIIHENECVIPTDGTVGRFPTEGLAVTGFQLLGIAPCANSRLVATDIDVVVDFGADVQEYVPDNASIDTEHKLFISVNNPYPTIPDFTLIPNPNPSLLPSYVISNHNFLNDKIGDVGLSGGEVAEPKIFFDQQLGDPRFILAEVTIQENSIKDKIQKNHILLQGDKVEVLYYTWGKFGGTFKGQDVLGVFKPLWLVQKFTWDDQGVQIKCPEGETLREDRTCKPANVDICEFPNKRGLDGVCRPPVIAPTNGCTSPQVSDGMGGCKDPEIDVTKVCEASLPQNIPICDLDTEDPVPTGETDTCDLPFLECKPKGTSVDKPKVDDGLPREKEPNPDGGCDPMFVINTATGKCEIIGGGGIETTEPPAGGNGEGGFCANILTNFSQCLAEIVAGFQTGLPTFMLPTEIPVEIFVVIGIAMILLIALGIFLRRRGRI